MAACSLHTRSSPCFRANDLSAFRPYECIRLPRKLMSACQLDKYTRIGSPRQNILSDSPGESGLFRISSSGSRGNRVPPPQATGTNNKGVVLNLKKAGTKLTSLGIKGMRYHCCGLSPTADFALDFPQKPILSGSPLQTSADTKQNFLPSLLFSSVCLCTAHFTRIQRYVLLRKGSSQSTEWYLNKKNTWIAILYSPHSVLIKKRFFSLQWIDCSTPLLIKNTLLTREEHERIFKWKDLGRCYRLYQSGVSTGFPSTRR